MDSFLKKGVQAISITCFSLAAICILLIFFLVGSSNIETIPLLIYGAQISAIAAFNAFTFSIIFIGVTKLVRRLRKKKIQ